MHHFLVHNDEDNVGVAVCDIRKGESITGVYQHSGHTVHLVALADIPLGHKVALRNMEPQDAVIKYGQRIGKLYARVAMGDHVHVHNLKSVRWAHA